MGKVDPAALPAAGHVRGRGLWAVALVLLGKPDRTGLAAVNLLVTVTFCATAVFVSAERDTGSPGRVWRPQPLLRPLNWVNEWSAGPLPLIAELEGPLSALLAVWALLHYLAPWPRQRQEAIAVAAASMRSLLASG